MSDISNTYVVTLSFNLTRLILRYLGSVGSSLSTPLMIWGENPI